jgi:hypothetical protein
MKEQFNVDASARLQTLLSQPVLRSALRREINPGLYRTILPDGSTSTGNGTSASSPTMSASAGLPVWAYAAGALVLGVGAAFFFWRK